jgi:hypothetical protein
VSDIRPALGVLCRGVLYPLIRILLRFGVSAGEFKAMVDSVYAHAGAEYLAEQREKVTHSKLAVITGINRAFLPAILACSQNEFYPRSNTQLHRASRVLNGWYDDKLFQTSHGDPAVLPLDGEHRSFRQLVDLYSGGIYHRTMLSELVRVGAIRVTSGGRVQAIRRDVVSSSASLESILATASIASDTLSTLEYNLKAPAEKKLPIQTTTGRIDPSSVPKFKERIETRADALLDAVGRFMRAHAPVSASAESGSTGVEVGAMVIAIHRTSAITGNISTQDPET